MTVCDIATNKLVPNMSVSTSLGRSNSPQIIDLTFLSEVEEEKLRAVLEEDLKLQQAEESRLKYSESFTVLLLCNRCIDR